MAASSNNKLKVALVDPPFGPRFVPNLGLGILSAGIKQQGFDCRTFYWSQHVLSRLPGADVHQKCRMYARYIHLFPWSEWTFGRQVFPELAERDEQLLHEFERRTRGPWWWRLVRRSSNLAHESIMFLRQSVPSLVEEMVDKLEPYDIIGISSTFHQNIPALSLARSVKLRWPTKIIVFGGANCEDEMGRTLLEQFSFIDYVFSGEVDFSFPDFVRVLSSGGPAEQVRGIVYRDEAGAVTSGPAAQPLEDMDRLPIPDYDDYMLDLEQSGVLASGRRTWIALESSRGCWWGVKNHCTFCGLNTSGMAYRQKSQERFQWEIEEVVRRYGVRSIATTDNILSMNYFKGFMDWARQNELQLNFFYETKSNLNRTQVESLAAAGVSSFQPGIESFSTDVLRLMKKGVRGIQNVALLRYAREAGVETSYSILAGFPGENPDEYDAMAKNVRRLIHLQPPGRVCEIVYDRFSPYYQAPERYGIRLRPEPNYSILYPFPKEVLSRLVYHFERDDNPDFSYLAAIRRQVDEWRLAHSRHRNGEQTPCTLTWERDGAGIAISDSRPGFPRRNYRLERYAVDVFLALDQPTTLKALGRAKGPEPSEDAGTGAAPASGNGSDGSRKSRPSLVPETAVISFSKEEFLANPEICLEPFVEAALLYIEDDWYVRLPVSAGAPELPVPVGLAGQ